MTQLGTETNPLRVAIIGSGPAAFYAAETFVRQTNIFSRIDMFDRLPTPFGWCGTASRPITRKSKA